MANPLYLTTRIGTIGELLVQMRLLQYGIECFPPLKDSGNDLISIYRKIATSIQVKTTTKEKIFIKRTTNDYDILALVFLSGTDEHINIESSTIKLIKKNQIISSVYSREKFNEYNLSERRIDELFN